MKRSLRFLAAALTLAAATFLGSTGHAQGLYYKEVTKDGRIYVFNSAEAYKTWEKTGEMGKSITLIGRGKNGETLVADSETAIDLYNLKNDTPGYERPAPKPAAPVIPTTLKVGDGELKFGLLLQGWYVTDDSKASTGTSWLGNTTGYNTFRLRRSEIKLSGKITPSWGFEVMFDPSKAINTAAGADGKILQDLGVTFLGLKGHEFTLGQKKIVITEEGLRSSSDLDFAERAQVTRAFSDRRETGFFYKGDYGSLVTAYASITNGTPSNVLDDSNDTVFYAARLDFKVMPGLLLGASGGTSGGEGAFHLGRDRYGVHVKYDGPAELPLAFRAEYLEAKDESRNATSGAITELERNGFYLTGMYTIAGVYQLAVRYDQLDNNKNASNAKTKMFTGGFHYMIKGKNINLKAEYFSIKQDGRTVNGVLDESYGQFALAAQVAF